MSGTSLDGVDAVLGEFHSPTPQLVGKYHLPFSSTLKHQLAQLQNPAPDELHLSHLAANQLAHVYAQAVHTLLATTGYKAEDISAIGCHGQTIRHRPECGYTIQLGNAALLAELTHINVINDFRSRDIAAQGQGAPLVPAFHAAIFSHPTISRAIINIGGISNLSYLPAPQALIEGFDCGPGNVLMDYWVAQHLGQAYDYAGQWAGQGQCITQLLTAFLTEPFFHLAPPKSTGRDLFNPTWLNRYLSPYQNLPAADIQATLLALTVQGMVNAIHRYPDIKEVYICGGGAYNTALYQLLAQQLPQCAVATTAVLGVAAEDVEALAFAWLAYQTLQQRPGNLPAVTGARGLRILGSTTYA
jgi:anhydro-N-acetylmuramic acid kinase